MGASSSKAGYPTGVGGEEVQAYLTRFAELEGKVATCQEEIERLKSEKDALRSQLGAILRPEYAT